MDAKQEKIKRFLDDKIMSEGVFEEIQNTFLESTRVETQVHMLAASHLALQKFRLAWKRLARFQIESAHEESVEQSGL